MGLGLISLTCFDHGINSVLLLDASYLKLASLRLQDLVLPPHDVVSVDLVSLDVHPDCKVSGFLLSLLLNLLQQVFLQICVLLFAGMEVPLHLVVLVVVCVSHISVKHVVEELVIHLVELGQVGLLNHRFLVLLRDLLLSGHTLVHLLHVVIVILNEWSHGVVQLLD